MILETFLELRSLSTYHPSDPGGWWSDTESATGIDVTPFSALANTPFHQGVTLISEMYATLPLFAYRLNSKGEAERDREGDLYHLLRYEPNPEASAFTHRSAQMLNKLLWGNAYAEIERDRTGRPIRLWHLPSWLVTPRRVYKRLGGGLTTSLKAATPEDRKRGGVVMYEVRDEQGAKPVWLGASDVWHVPGKSFNGLQGFSVLSVARESIAIGLAMQESAAAIYGNASQPGAVLERPEEAPPLSPVGERNLIAAWEAQHGGVKRTGRVAVLQEGTSYKPVVVSMRELQYAEALKGNVPEMARLLNISPYFLGHDGSQNTYTNVEGEWIRLSRQTLMPHTTADEQEVIRKLVFEEDAGKVWAEYEYKVLLRADSESRARYYQAIKGMGAMTAGEIARLEGLPPVPEDQGGNDFRPTAAAPPPFQAQPTPPAPPPPPVEPDADDEEDEEEDDRTAQAIDLVKRFRAVLVATLQRIVNREVKELRAAFKRFTDPAELREALRLLYENDLPTFAAELTTPALDSRAADFARAYAKRHAAELEQRLAAAKPEAVLKLLDAWSASAAAEEADRELAFSN